MKKNGQSRRTQAERTAETREALLQATIKLLFEKGYSGTTTELIAVEAGVSRGALRHHFPTRAQLMSDVIDAVYEDEHQLYLEMRQDATETPRLSDWPEMLWAVLSRPSGLAVLEILQASRSNPELTDLVASTQSKVEQISVTRVANWVGRADLPAIRFFVWAIRGLALAQILMPDPEDIRLSVAYFRDLVASAEKQGDFGRQPPVRD